MAFGPSIGWNAMVFDTKIGPPGLAYPNSIDVDSTANSLGPAVIRPAAERSMSLSWLGLIWDRIGRGSSEPARRVRPWGSTLAAVALAGTAAGLLRLLIGFWAVALCCRRGRPVDDLGMIGLLEELQSAMRCRLGVALREVPDLTTPATAGRLRPVLLLPADWRSWTDAERRACSRTSWRISCAAIMRRACWPGSRWCSISTTRLCGGWPAGFSSSKNRLPTRWLLSLREAGLVTWSPFAPCFETRWTVPALAGEGVPAGAWGPDQEDRHVTGRIENKAVRPAVVDALADAHSHRIGRPDFGCGDTSRPGPRRGRRPFTCGQCGGKRPQLRDPSKSFIAPYVREGRDGVVLIRPAAAFRHKGLGPLFEFYRAALDEDASLVIKQLKIDTSRQGFMKLRLEDIEWVTSGIGFGRSAAPKVPSKPRTAIAGGADMPLHSIQFGSLAARMVGPFDWLAYLRQWRVEFKETDVKGRTYYKVTGEFEKILGPLPCIFLPDDRTIVFDAEDAIRKIAGGDDPAPPAYLRGKEWERASRGLVAIAINNQKNTFTKHYDIGRSDDAVVVSLFHGIDHWIISADDADPISLHADATCQNRDAGEAVCRSLNSVIKLDATKSPDAATHPRTARMLNALAANVRFVPTDTAINVEAQNFGSLADFGAIVIAEEQEPKAPVAARTMRGTR